METDRRNFMVGLGAVGAALTVAKVAQAQSEGEVAWLEHMERAHYASEPHQGDSYSYLSVSADYGLCDRPPAFYGASMSSQHISNIVGLKVNSGNIHIPSPPWTASEMGFALVSFRLKGSYKGIKPADLMPTFVETPSPLSPTSPPPSWRTGDQSPGEYNAYCEAQKAHRCDAARRQQQVLEQQAAMMAYVASMYATARGTSSVFGSLARLVTPLTVAATISGTIAANLGYAAYQMRYMVEVVCANDACA